MEIKVNKCNESMIDEYKHMVSKYAKVSVDDIRIQYAYNIDGMQVIRYAYEGMLLAYVNDPESKPKQAILYLMDAANYTGEWLEAI